MFIQVDIKFVFDLFYLIYIILILQLVGTEEAEKFKGLVQFVFVSVLSHVSLYSTAL